MLTRLAEADRSLVTLPDRHGAVLVAPGLQGRIFAAIDGRLIHRLDADLMEHPQPGAFNNLGGNSLWPAPEGGPFAFNYLPGAVGWVVQEGIGRDPAQVIARDLRSARIAKAVRIVNRRGIALSLRWSRRVELRPVGPDIPSGVGALGYVTEDALEPLEPCDRRDVLLAAWSLEQFPGGDEVTAFGRVAVPSGCLNDDYYEAPEPPPAYNPNGFTLVLGGRRKFQVGVRAACDPQLLGALDARRSVLILRRTPRLAGAYFNIADNEQPRGPWSAADMYSVFNGGDLKFFELETIGALQTAGSRVLASRLVSETVLLAGPIEALKQWLRRAYGVEL